ncbi:hypothetical protein M9Y10_041417 [Tritrichomonas musculus]|uniref:Uncharacterized protein n=1 Tax=Tritrichomonas musculus TaxID=1915356 RepID=A0ABR2K515_9EUKA
MQKEHEYLPSMPKATAQNKRKTHQFRRKITNVHEATERDKRIRMANPRETEAEFSKRVIMESDARRYAPPHDSVYHFFKTRDEITPSQKEKMNQSVDAYIVKLKKSKKVQKREYAPRELRTNEIPNDLHSPYTDFVAPKVSRRITRDFDERNFYQTEYKPLTPMKSDLFVYKAFRDYLDKNKERIPSMMHDEIEREEDRRRHLNKSGNPRRKVRYNSQQY